MVAMVPNNTKMAEFEVMKCIKTTTFDNANDVLCSEIKQMETLTNFNALYGIPSYEQLNECFSSEQSLLNWVLTEHPEILKIPSCCPICSNKLTVDKKK